MRLREERTYFLLYFLDDPSNGIPVQNVFTNKPLDTKGYVLGSLGYNENMRSVYDYIAIDLKSFYASVECMDRGLDPLATNLVVADASRTEKTICLAVSPSLKAYGIGGRARLFEVVEQVRAINTERASHLRTTRSRQMKNMKPSATSDLPNESDCTGRDLDAYRPASPYPFRGASFHDPTVRNDLRIELDYLIAKPHMARYLEISTRIYEVYLKYFSPDDIHVYSIDEVFIDASKYSAAYKMETKELASCVVTDVFKTTGITATAGIGTNMYLAKVAMDILAKHEPPDENGVRIAALDELTYRKRLWTHTPLTDFWRIGKGYADKLEANGMFCMGDVARCSLGGAHDRRNEDLLFKLFGKNAELLIDHAWGYEPVTMKDVKEYRPSVNCKASGQVLQHPYPVDKTRLVVWEMADQLALDLMAERLETDKLTITIGYDRENLTRLHDMSDYSGEITIDRFGRAVPKHAHGTIDLADHTSSSHAITQAALELFDRIIDPALLAKRVTITAEHVISENDAAYNRAHRQMTIDDCLNADEVHNKEISAAKERQLQSVMLDVRNKFGKNAVLRAASLQEGATAQQRNNQIGGHNA